MLKGGRNLFVVGVATGRHSSPLTCVFFLGVPGLLSTQPAKQRHVLLLTAEKLSHRSDQPQPLPALQATEVSCPGHEPRR